MAEEVTPYARARSLHALGVTAEQIEKTLVAEGLDPESAKLAVGAAVRAAAVPAPEDPVFPTSEAPGVATPPPTNPCPAHPAWPITGTCSRCGKFFCAACVRDSKLPEDVEDASRCPECRARFPKLQGLGGWLILPAFHLLATPVSILVTIASEVKIIVGDGIDPSFTAPVAAAMVLNCTRVAYTVVAAVAFFRKKKRAIALCLGFYVFNVLAAVGEVGLEGWMESIAGRKLGSSGSAGTDVVRALIGSTIWLAYFVQSKRVRATFVVE